MGIRFRSHGRPSLTVRTHGGACSPQNAVSASHIVAYRQTALSRAATRFIADRRLATALRQVTMAHDLAPRARSQPAGTTEFPGSTRRWSASWSPPRAADPLSRITPARGCSRQTHLRQKRQGLRRPAGGLSAKRRASTLGRRAFGCCVMNAYAPQRGHEDRLHRA
jgi:hypothetical protein